MAFRIKPGVNVIDMLKSAGYSTYRIRKEKIIGERALQKFRGGDELPSWNELDIICGLLHVEPWNIVERVEGND